MAQPTPYNRQASFTTIQQAAPADPLPGDTLDAELNAVKQTLDELLANIALIQRDDGRLANGSVGRQQLDASLNLGFNAPEAWHSGTNYSTLDTVFNDGKFYRCLISHLSGDDFNTDLAAGKWELIADFAGALGAAVNVAVTPSGNLSSDNAQLALEELQGDIDTINALDMLADPAVAPSSPASDDDSLKVATTAWVRDLVAAQVALSTPTGSMKPYGGSTAPDGWLLCDGSAVSRTTYAALFTAIGTTFGTGDGSTTFNVPDLRGRVPVGKDNMGGTAASRVTSAASGLDGATLGAAGGAQTHTLTIAQMPSHDHNGVTGDDTPDHTHTEDGANATVQNAGTVTGSGNVSPRNTQTSGASNRHHHPITAQGGGGAHNNMQPSLVVNWIIYTGKLA